MTINITATDIAYHRNGICGAPFHIVFFNEEESRKVGIIFDAPYHCAVFDMDKLKSDDIAFGSNSWRGDQYEFALRAAIDKFYSEWQQS